MEIKGDFETDVVVKTGFDREPRGQGRPVIWLDCAAGLKIEIKSCEKKVEKSSCNKWRFDKVALPKMKNFNYQIMILKIIKINL